jgi:UDP-N-acetylmuramoylalanine--D-glutamate ligase
VFCGADAGAIERALAGFGPDPHRLEFVGEVDGVRFYNDSIATNPHAAVTAIRSFDRVVLIAGGRKKVPDLSPLAGEAPRIVAVVAIGEAAGDIEHVFEGRGVPVERAGSMLDAVRLAAAEASRGDVVLLAPACASLDAYANYAERGQDFVQACRSLGVRM